MNDAITSSWASFFAVLRLYVYKNDYTAKNNFTRFAYKVIMTMSQIDSYRK